MLDRLLPKLPLIQKWIDTTLASHEANARSVQQLGFARLPQYFSKIFLNNAKCVSISSVPVPPLSAIGLIGFSDFEKDQYDGITYKDTYFLNSTRMKDESLHFHELVHVIQWQHLGVEKFLTAYALELRQFDYQGNRLEIMAYKHQANFEKNKRPYDVEESVKKELDALLPSIL